MSNAVSFARSRNRCLERFLELSIDFLKFLANADSAKLNQELRRFERERDSTLKGLELFERKLREEAEALDYSVSPELIQELKLQIKRRDDIVHRILDTDLQIMGRIEQIKSQLLKELSRDRVAKERLGKFKSGSAQNAGTEVDHKV
jgi:hypothetical protein